MKITLETQHVITQPQTFEVIEMTQVPQWLIAGKTCSVCRWPLEESTATALRLQGRDPVIIHHTCLTRLNKNETKSK